MVTEIKRGNNYETLIIEKEKQEKGPTALPKETLQQISRNAIGDAMMVAYSHDVNGKANTPQTQFAEGEAGLKEIDEFVRESTFSECIHNSQKTIEYLIDKYPRHFDRLLMLITYEKSPNPEDGKHRDQTWGKHACFLARDQAGYWYSGSPANYDPRQFPEQLESNPLNTYYQSADLSEVLSKLQKDEGGLWPTTEFIQQGFIYVHPRRVLKYPWSDVRETRALMRIYAQKDTNGDMNFSTHLSDDD